jgi:serine/threonine protein kinase/tetratricopeptide (TPR) repeat protein
VNATDDAQGPVELLAQEFLDRCKRGERPTIGEYCQQYPEHAGEIREIFEAVLVVEDLRPGFINLGGSIGGLHLDEHGRRLEHIGGYRILREIGRGGMGVVYEAEQEALGRRVALKVLPGALAGDANARARFDREARAAARMHHTNIVPVFDVGQDDGYIFYAMQMIHGQGLDMVIEQLKGLRDQNASPAPDADGDGKGTAKPSLAASLILGRFEQDDLAAGTSSDTHAGLVEEAADHQGTMPSSAVLPGQSDLASAQINRRAYYRSIAQIGLQCASALSYAHARGVVHRDIKPSNLLLDATGVVWITDFGLAKTADLSVTQTGDILGTIRYMSPERFRGQCDARADVYALGMTLYELLALKPAFVSPYRVGLIEQIRHVEPRSPRTMDSRLPRDLETIVLKAIDKDPKGRYQSADELSEDLRHFIAGEPIKARRIWMAERLARWVARHPAVASLLAAVFLVMAAGTAVSIAQASRALRAEGAALAAAKAEKQARHAAEQREAETRAVLEFVENKVIAAARPEGQAGGQGNEVTLRKAIEASLPHIASSFRDQPLIEARLRRTLGNSFSYLGEPQIAHEQFDAARALYTKFRGKDHPDTLKTMNNLAVSYSALGRLAEALKLFEETLALRKAKLGPGHPDTLTSMNNLANSYQELGRLADALKLFEETLALSKAKFGLGHPRTLTGMNNLVNCYQELGRHAEALKLSEEVVALRKAKLGPHHPDTLTSMTNLANSYQKLGRLADALKLREETLALQKAKLGRDHPDTLGSMHNLAATYQALGRYAEALKLDEQTLAAWKVKPGPDHPNTLRSLHNLAASYYALGRYAEALKLFEETVALMKAKLGPGHPETLVGMNNVAQSYGALGRHAEALKLHEETLALREDKLGANHPDTIQSQAGVARSLLQLGRGAEAVALARQAAELWEERKGTHASSLYDAARYRAITAAVVRASENSPEGAKQADAEADRAMAWLKEAVAAGWNDFARMAADNDLNALRDRVDFKVLVAGLEARMRKKS